MLKNIKENLKKYKILIALRDSIYRIKAVLKAFINGNKGMCPCCQAERVYFLELDPSYVKKYYQFNKEFLNCEMLNVEKHSCSKCGASDRERLYALWMNRNVGNNIKNILEIAPGKATSEFIKRNLQNIDYKTLDLFRTDVDYKLDIMDMHDIDDDSFDMFICSHVLEHVDNDIAAMKELRRVLRVNGCGIMTVPIPLNNKLFEENINDTIDNRWIKFGDATHVRVYTKKAFIERAAIAGLEVREFGVDYFGRALYDKHCITSTSVLYVAYKV